jgi:hypothetical protein
MTGMAGGDQGPSEAEVQAMLAQMREAPAEQVLVEVLQVLLQAVQVKLGRPDARLLIDAVAAVASATAGRVDANLHGQVLEALTQLRLAQVEEERRTGVTVADDAVPTPTDPSAPGSATAAPTPPARPAGQGAAASRLWVPGR